MSSDPEYNIVPYHPFIYRIRYDVSNDKQCVKAQIIKGSKIMRIVRTIILTLVIGTLVACADGAHFLVNNSTIPPTDHTENEVCKDPLYRNFTAGLPIEFGDKAYWRITFEVICGELVGNKEISFWRNQRLLHREVTPLKCSLVNRDGSLTQDTADFVLADRVVLTGEQHVECQDIDTFGEVVDGISQGAIHFCDEPSASSIPCEIFTGSSVAVHAEISMSATDNIQPLVFYPQLHADGVALGLEPALNQAREIALSLSGREVTSEVSYQVDQAWHVISAHQQEFFQDNDDPVSRLTFLVDGLGLSQTPMGAVHEFSSEKLQTLYIGYNPTATDDNNFVGEIRSVIVDPSDSCLSCFPTLFLR
ncbi:MAG: hypothetical protein R2932_10385 [Caldilineaceae bacterium]